MREHTHARTLHPPSPYFLSVYFQIVIGPRLLPAAAADSAKKLEIGRVACAGKNKRLHRREHGEQGALFSLVDNLIKLGFERMQNWCVEISMLWVYDLLERDLYFLKINFTTGGAC